MIAGNPVFIRTENLPNTS